MVKINDCGWVPQCFSRAVHTASRGPWCASNGNALWCCGPTWTI